MQQKINESEYELIPLQEEASSRRYFLARNPSGEEFVLCRDSNGVNKDFLELAEFLRSHNIPVPRILGYDPNSGLIFQEFCGWTDVSSLDEDSYLERLVRILDLIHALQQLQPPPFVQSRRFDCEKLSQEVNLTWDTLQTLQRREGWEIFMTEELRIFLLQCCEYLDRHPESVFVHRDFHSRNLLLHPISRHEKYGDLVVIDFQDARMGSPQYDLASILYDAYKPLSLSVRTEFMERFQSLLNNPIRFRETYYIQALQRSFKALGTYLIQFGFKGNRKFLPSIFRCLENLKEICQLGHFPDSVYIFADSFLRYEKKL